MKELIAIAVQTKTPVLIWGRAGEGKTSFINALAQKMELPCETVIAAIREPSDFAGLPVVSDGKVHFAPPSWAVRLCEAGRGILFLDEISCAPPAVQAALLRVVLERTVGDRRLPDGVSIVAAANPPELAAGGWELSPPLANRFVHINWDVDANEWVEGMAVGSWGVGDIPTLPENWSDKLPTSRAVVAAFMRYRPSLLKSNPTGGAYPTPRSWEMAAKLLAAVEALGGGDKSSLSLAAVTAAVGEGAAIEFMGWRKNLDLPDPEEVLRDPDSLSLPRRSDIAFAVLAAVIAAATSQKSLARWRAACQVVIRAYDSHPDVAVAVGRRLRDAQPEGVKLDFEELDVSRMKEVVNLLSGRRSGSGGWGRR